MEAGLFLDECVLFFVLLIFLDSFSCFFFNQLLTYRIGDDEFLGRATMATSVVAEQGEINNMWAELEDVPNGRILMSLSWLATTKDKSVLQGEKTKSIRRFQKEDFVFNSSLNFANLTCQLRYGTCYIFLPLSTSNFQN